MNAKTTEQKTAVFTPCAESAEATRAFPVLDEDTRELPLIADRFAGRYWDGRMEKETDETGEKPARKKTWRSALAFGAAAVAAMLLLVGSLTGQAELTAMNDELVAVSERISELKAEERTLLVETEKLPLLKIRIGRQMRVIKICTARGIDADCASLPVQAIPYFALFHLRPTTGYRPLSLTDGIMSVV